MKTQRRNASKNDSASSFLRELGEFEDRMKRQLSLSAFSIKNGVETKLEQNEPRCAGFDVFLFKLGLHLNELQSLCEKIDRTLDRVIEDPLHFIESSHKHHAGFDKQFDSEKRRTAVQSSNQKTEI